MTVDGTVFTSVTSFAVVWLNLHELKAENPRTSSLLYFCRLSSAVTELMILFIVVLGYTSLSQDRPKMLRFDMMNMHLVIPILTVVTFVLNDEAIGKCSWKKLTGGLIFLALYSVSMITLILLRVIPERKIPYKFLNFRTSQAWYTIGVAVIVFVVGYLFSVFLYWLNLKLSWPFWYKNLNGSGRKQKA